MQILEQLAPLQLAKEHLPSDIIDILERLRTIYLSTNFIILWKIDVEDLHSHFDSFKSIIKTDFKHLKEATSCNMQNIQTSLGIQQTYSTTLCSHVNNIYNKLSELQKHIQHHCMYPHQSDTVQINALEYDPDIDGDNQPNADKKHATVSVQGTLEMIPEFFLIRG